MKKVKISLQTLLCCLFAFTMYLFLSPFYMWDTYRNGSLYLPLLLLAYVALAIMAAYVLLIYQKKPVSLNNYCILSIIIFILLTIQMTWLTAGDVNPFSLDRWILVIYVVLFLLMPENIKKTVFNQMVMWFIVLCLPSVLYWVFEMVGIHLGGTYLRANHPLKAASGIYYTEYPLGLLIKGQWVITRPCGIFDEPGVLGTFAALFYSCSIGVKKKRLTNAALLLIGFLSMSLAFYILLIATIMVKYWNRGMKKAVFITAALALLYFAFINIDFENEYITNIQNRITITAAGLGGMNRIGNGFEQAYSAFVNEGGLPLAVGYGYWAYAKVPSMASSAEIRCLIYDIGIVGMVLLGMFLLTMFKGISNSKWNLIFLSVFLLSMYQRPHILSVTYMAVYILGLTAFNNTDKSGFQLKTNKGRIWNIWERLVG